MNVILLIAACSMLFASPAAAAGNESGNLKKSFTVGMGGSLDVSVNIGDILINTWDKNEVSVEVTSDEDEEPGGVRIYQKETTVFVEYEPRWGTTDGLQFRINVPSQFNVTMETSAGEIHVKGSLTGSVSGSTSGGNIMIGSVKGIVKLETSGGDIVTGDIDGDLALTTSGGDIRVGKVSGTSDVQTSGGEIVIERSGKSVNAETAGGNVNIGDVNGDAVVSTSGGDIIMETISGGAELKTAGGNIRVQGANGKVVAKTAGGDIVLENIVGSVDAKTSAGNLQVELTPSGAGKSLLSTSVGDVVLYLAENAKASVTARVKVKGWWRSRSEEENIYSDYKEDTFEKDERTREIRATFSLNGGGQAISLQATMGNIHILKPDEMKHSTKRKSNKR